MNSNQQKLSRGSSFAFTVEACGSLWDVYYFVKDGKRGMLAFRKNQDGKFEIGMMRAGDFTPDQVVEALRQAYN